MSEADERINRLADSHNDLAFSLQDSADIRNLIDDYIALRARVAKLEAALKDLRPNVDYHGHKKLDDALKDAPQ